jgi:putative nucleotidyltransferase with HDIG domain
MEAFVMAQPSTQSLPLPDAPRLLVVEDDTMVRDFCRRVLRMHGYLVMTAENGRKALNLLAEERFDLVLTDLQMPEVPGLQLLEHMRHNYPDTDAIVFTAYATVDTARDALRLGAFDYLTKPVSVEDLERTVRKCLEMRVIRREKERLSELVAMYEFSQTIASTLDTETQIDQILKLLNQRFAPRDVSISLVEAENKQLVLLGQTGLQVLQSSCDVPSERVDQTLIALHEDLIGASSDSNNTGYLVNQVLRTHDRPIGVLRMTRRPEQPEFDKDERRLLAVFASQIAASLDNAQLYQQLKEQHLQTVTALANAIEARDMYTRGHSEQVMRYAVRMMEVLGATPAQVELMRYAGLLHDIGKIGIRDQVLLKPGALSEEEYVVMKQHPVIGASIVGGIRSLHEALPIIRSHHERIDGRGYPDGLRDDEISLEARVLAIADSFEAMTSDRAYRKGMPVEVALQTLVKGRGVQWDAQLVDIFIDLIRREISQLRIAPEERVAQQAVGI